MCENEASGQQAVEQMLREEIRRMTGWNLSKNDCRNIVEKIHSAAPTAPSTAAGEMACQTVLRAYLDGISTICGANNREAAFLERIEDMAKAALATPSAQMKYGEKTYGEGRDEAANFIFTGLSEALGLDGFTIQDGSETWEGDVRATLMGILRDANVIDEETNERITPPAPSVPWE